MLRLIFFLFILPFLLKCSNNTTTNDKQLEGMVGQMLMVGFRGMEVDNDHWVVHDIRDYGIGGVILFDYDVPNGISVRNIESPEQVKSLVNQLKSYSTEPLFIAIDQEGGRVNRLKERYGFPPSVSHEYLGSVNNPDTTRYFAAQTAETLSELGININLAPVVDLNSNPDNPIIGQLNRSFSSNPDRVVTHASWFIEEHRNNGILTAVKHFPGHGSTWNDSHHGLADVTETWDELELVPYQNLINQGMTDMIMSAHIFNATWDAEHPATLTPFVMTELLRNEMKFDGVLISDDMQMGAITEYYGLEEAVRLAIHAGIDILIFANNSVYVPDITSRVMGIILNLVETGEVPVNRIEESYQRIMELKKQLQ